MSPRRPPPTTSIAITFRRPYPHPSFSSTDVGANPNKKGQFICLTFLVEKNPVKERVPNVLAYSGMPKCQSSDSQWRQRMGREGEQPIHQPIHLIIPGRQEGLSTDNQGLNPYQVLC